MARYYVNRNAQNNGDHEVHVKSCSYFPDNVKDLGEHSTCRSAVTEAKKTYSQSNGCYYCCNECHTT
jgi:hypothetical protein